MGKMVRLKAGDGHELDAYAAEPKGKAKGGIVRRAGDLRGHESCETRGPISMRPRVTGRSRPAMFDRVQRGITLDYTEIQQGIAYMQQLKVAGHAG